LLFLVGVKHVWRWLVSARFIESPSGIQRAGTPRAPRPPGPWSLAARSPEQKCGWDWEFFLIFHTASYYPLKRATRALWTRWREVTLVCSVPQSKMVPSSPASSPAVFASHGPNLGRVSRLVHRHHPRPSASQPNLPLSCVAAQSFERAGGREVKQMDSAYSACLLVSW
jgi:hypothetical protein